VASELQPQAAFAAFATDDVFVEIFHLFSFASAIYGDRPSSATLVCDVVAAGSKTRAVAFKGNEFSKDLLNKGRFFIGSEDRNLSNNISFVEEGRDDLTKAALQINDTNDDVVLEVSEMTYFTGVGKAFYIFFPFMTIFFIEPRRLKPL